VLIVGPIAIKNCEPRQIWKEAAISSIFYVPMDSLAGANWPCNVQVFIFDAGCAINHRDFDPKKKENKRYLL